MDVIINKKHCRECPFKKQVEYKNLDDGSKDMMDATLNLRIVFSKCHKSEYKLCKGLSARYNIRDSDVAAISMVDIINMGGWQR